LLRAGDNVAVEGRNERPPTSAIARRIRFYDSVPVVETNVQPLNMMMQAHLRVHG
jgi:hypothetical protein